MTNPHRDAELLWN